MDVHLFLRGEGLGLVESERKESGGRDYPHKYVVI